MTRIGLTASDRRSARIEGGGIVRLIDADALKDEMRAGCVPINLGGITGITGDDDSIEDYIDAAPTIDAIPVEWLEKQASEQGPYSVYCQAAIEILLYDWKDLKNVQNESEV